MSAQALGPEDRDLLAAEHALGLLEADDLDTAMSLEAIDRDFRRLVARWSLRFAPLLDQVEPLSPPASLRAAILGRIGGPAGDPEGSNVIQLRRRLGRWRGAAIGAGALAASLALALVTIPQSDPVGVEDPGPAVREAGADPMVARLEGDGGGVVMVASWDRSSRRLLVTATGGLSTDPDRSHELWVIPAGGQPRSLGLVPDGTSAQIRLDPVVAPQLDQGSTIAISLEPRGGSPTGLPTGPVIASGPLEGA